MFTSIGVVGKPFLDGFGIANARTESGDMRENKHSLAILLLVALSLIFPAEIVAEQIEKGELFDLCSIDLKKMNLRVNIVDSDVILIPRRGMEYKVRNMVESRLRRARVYSNEIDVPYVFVTLAFLGTEGVAIATSTTIGYSQLISDYWGIIGAKAVTTWSQSHIGIGHAIDDEYFAHIREMMDIFLVDYLRVNESRECWSLRNKVNRR